MSLGESCTFAVDHAVQCDKCFLPSRLSPTRSVLAYVCMCLNPKPYSMGGPMPRDWRLHRSRQERPYCRRRGGEDGRKFEFDQGAAIAIAHEPVLAELCVFLFGGRGDSQVGDRLVLCP